MFYLKYQQNYDLNYVIAQDELKIFIIELFNPNNSWEK